MILLALGVDVVNFEELKKDTIEAIKPLSSTLGRNPCSMNRFVAHKESILGLTGEAAEKELEKRVALAAHTYFTLARNTQTN